MLVNDGEMLFNDCEMLLNDSEISEWSYTQFTIIDEHFTIINEHFTIISLMSTIMRSFHHHWEAAPTEECTHKNKKQEDRTFGNVQTLQYLVNGLTKGSFKKTCLLL